jgi:hypothetical protein
MTLTINPDLKSLIPPLTAEEFAQLEANLLAHGCRDPLVVWQETQTLLDGHNRLTICDEHGLTYDTHEVSLPDLDAAKAWMITNQLGRRNLTLEQASYLRGEQYKLHKNISRGGGDHRSNEAIDQKVQSEPFDDTATRLAKDYKVSRSTMKRDGAYADAIDTVADVLGPEVRQAILARDTKITRDGVSQLADLARVDGAAAQAALTDIQAAPTVKDAREALTRHVGAGQAHGARSGERTESPAPAIAVEGQAPVPDEEGDSPAPAIFTEMEEPEDDERPHRNRYGVVTDQDQVVAARFGTTASPEWYTPADWVERARRALGGHIDTDPASCAAAQAVVQARTFYALAEDGLQQPWAGTVFRNPPFNDVVLSRFIGKLHDELRAERTVAAIMLTNNCTETHWFEVLATTCQRIAFPRSRAQFWQPDRGETHPPQGQALFYFGVDVPRFDQAFTDLANLSRPWEPRTAPQLDLPTACLAPKAPTPAPAELESPPAQGASITIAEQCTQALRAVFPAGLTNAQVAKAITKKQTDTFAPLERLVRHGKARKEGTTYFSVAQKETSDAP